MLGYPLEVQHQILQRSLEEFGRNIWDQSLTYGHYNLHDTSLMKNPIGGHPSFADYCRDQNVLVLAAAPLSMGLLTNRGPPEWHPASSELKEACARAAKICQTHNVDVSTLALLFAMSNPNIPCSILGMGTVEEVKANHAVALRFAGLKSTEPEEIMKEVMTDDEMEVWTLLHDPIDGPFASVWVDGTYKWNGVEEAQTFWKRLDKQIVNWQASASL